MSLYDDLGVTPNADADAIKRAYRKKAQEVHPDKPGGDKEKFQAVVRAYEVLSDSARREKYDRTGRADSIGDQREEMMRELAQLFLNLVDQVDVDHNDIVKLMRQNIKATQDQLREAIKANERKIAMRERAHKRIVRKGTGDNVFARVLRIDISRMQQAIERSRDQIKMGGEMLNLLEEYSYQAEAQPAGSVGLIDGLRASFR